MARLLTVISERKKICEDYRTLLENEYIEKQRKIYEEKLADEEAKKAKELYVPPITSQLIQAKYRDLKRGVDNIEYIKEAIEIDKRKRESKEKIKGKYDYKNKKISKLNEEVPENEKNNFIKEFTSSFKEQLSSNEYKISQEEVLRSHIKNWKMLNLKQRRVVLGFLNARRAKDAKAEFLKELNLLGQKIAFDNAQQRKEQEREVKA